MLQNLGQRADGNAPDRSCNPIFGGRLFATKEPSKIKEYSSILGYQIAAATPALDVPPFEDNRIIMKMEANAEYEMAAEAVAQDKAIKAFHFYNQTPVVVENVLIFIPALDGFPGVATEDMTEGPNLPLLSRQSFNTRFSNGEKQVIAIATLAVFDPAYGFDCRHGVAVGMIAAILSGENGFGWDRLFKPLSFGAHNPQDTYADLAPEIKNLISMRSAVIQALRARPFYSSHSPLLDGSSLDLSF
jgi:inosine/xanthosine triphosphate pyrophosphatase family protein